MAGWQGEGRDTISWDGTIKAKNFIGDGSQLTGISATGGVTSWNTRTGAVVPATDDYTLNQIADLTADKTFSMTTRLLKFRWANPIGADPFTLEQSGTYTGAVLRITQNTGNPGACYLLSLDSTDPDVEHIKSSGATVDVHSICTYVSGDADERFILNTGGMLEWGDGASPEDTNLYRSSANVLKTDDSLFVVGTASAATLYAGTQNVGTHIASGGIHTRWDLVSNGKIDITNLPSLTASYAVTPITSAMLPYLGASYAVTASYAATVLALNATAASGATTSQAYFAHAADASDPHGSQLTQTYLTVSTAASAALLEITGDQSTASAAYVLNSVYSTLATPPTASNYPIGTLYFQYTP